MQFINRLLLVIFLLLGKGPLFSQTIETMGELEIGLITIYDYVNNNRDFYFESVGNTVWEYDRYSSTYEISSEFSSANLYNVPYQDNSSKIAVRKYRF